MLHDKVLQAIEMTKQNDRLVLSLAFNYGGRDEIVCAIREIITEGIPVEELTPDVVSQHLFTAGIPDPDLIIRTGGEYRLSNFLLWQAAYAEYYATTAFWPDFDEVELAAALAAFSHRDRRFGKVPTVEG